MLVSYNIIELVNSDAELITIITSKQQINYPQTA